MYLLEEPNLRWCGFCLQPWPANLEYFARHKHGRHSLSSVCRWSSNEDRAVRALVRDFASLVVVDPSCSSFSLFGPL